MMLLQLVFEDQWFIPVPVDPRLQEALDVQRERAFRNDLDVSFLDRLAASISNALAECLDTDLQLPTSNQVRYASDIARELGIGLPADALRFRGAAHEYIDRFEEDFKKSRLSHLSATQRSEVQE